MFVFVQSVGIDKGDIPDLAKVTVIVLLASGTDPISLLIISLFLFLFFRGVI